MIRYRWKSSIPLQDAAQYLLPESASLKGRGPWVWTSSGGHVMATMDYPMPEGASWGEWQKGIGPYEVSMITPLPAYDASMWEVEGCSAIRVNLSSGISVPVHPLSLEGASIHWDGTAGLPVSPFGKACVALLERIASGDEVLSNDPQLLDAVRWSLSYGLKMTRELMHAYGMLNDADMTLIMEAIADSPKA